MSLYRRAKCIFQKFPHHVLHVAWNVVQDTIGIAAVLDFRCTSVEMFGELCEFTCKVLDDAQWPHTLAHDTKIAFFRLAHLHVVVHEDASGYSCREVIVQKAVQLNFRVEPAHFPIALCNKPCTWIVLHELPLDKVQETLLISLCSNFRKAVHSIEGLQVSGQYLIYVWIDDDHVR